MAISSVLTTAASGLQANARKAENAANNIANVSTEGYKATRVSLSTVTSGGGATSGTAVEAQLIGTDQNVDMTSEIVMLKEAELAYRANASVIRTADEIAKETLRINA